MLPDQLRTPRLILREPRAEDAQPIFDAYSQDVDIARYMVWRPHASVAETESFLSYCMGGWASGKSRPYVLTLHDAADTPIGMLEARIQSHIVDIGYVLARRHWGSGLMPEAVRELCSAVLSLPEFFRVQATCDVDNVASARTLEKSGFVREARLERYTVHPNVDADPRACFMFARWRSPDSPSSARRRAAQGAEHHLVDSRGTRE